MFPAFWHGPSRHAAPVLGWVMSGSGTEYGHLKDSILNFPTVSEWTGLMEEAGETRTAPITVGTIIATTATANTNNTRYQVLL